MAHVASSFLLQLALQVDQNTILQENTSVLCSPDDEAIASYWAYGDGHWTAAHGCDVARQEEDFSYWSQTWPAGYTALRGEAGYQDPALRTA
ncbi:NHX7, partial [Symbiodinium pilosum]